MMKLIRILFLAIGLFLTACATEEKKPNTHILVFLDKSLSSDTVNNSQQVFVNRLIEDNLQTNGDRIQFSFLYAHTGGSNTQTYKLEAPEGDPQSRKEQEDYEFQCDQAYFDIRNEIRDYFKKAISDKNKAASSGKTEIWGSLAVAKEFFKTAKPEDKRIIVYLSDMIQSADNREFHNTDYTADEARKFGSTDLAKIIQLYQLDNKFLTATEINVMFPVTKFISNRKEIMRPYWETIFKGLGASYDKITMN